MKEELRKKGLDWIKVGSAGISACQGISASENARIVAKRLGLSLDRFRSKPLTLARAQSANLILTMTDAQKRQIVEKWPALESKTMTISEFSGSKNKSIADPLGGSVDVYLDCARVIRDEVRRIVKKIARTTHEGESQSGSKRGRRRR